MNKVRKKFVIYASVALFVILAVLLSVINIIGFTMAAQDADRVTMMIASDNGKFADVPDENGSRIDRPAGMGPESPEIRSSVRYFTFRFGKNGEEETVAFNVSAFTEEEAKETARSLIKEKTGWIKTTYRYRTYRHDGYTYVTVIDYGRELLPAYRTLIISVIGAIICMIVSAVFLAFVGKKLFKPLEEADRKQKNFIKEAEKGFKVPLTVISADTEILERQNGSNEYTKSINRQVKKLTEITKELHALAIFDEKEMKRNVCDLSQILLSAADRRKKAFEEKGIAVTTSVEPGIMIDGDSAALNGMISEIVENALKFSLCKASFELKNENGIPRFTAENDTELKEGDTEQIFDRFTRLDNAEGKPGSGLGLSYVKDVVKAHNGRMSASVHDGMFTLRITL